MMRSSAPGRRTGEGSLLHRLPRWPWLVGAAAIAVVAIMAGSTVMSWTRGRGAQPRDEALEALDRMSEAGSLEGPDLGAAADLPVARGSMTGLTAAEGSLLSNDPVEGRDA